MEKINPDFIMLFGSQATGDTHPESDVDIAFFKKDSEFSAYEIFLFAGELSAILGHDVDLINLVEASTVFKAQIFSKGKLLFCKDQDEFANYEIQVYSMFAALNEENQGILHEIVKRGSVYGYLCRHE